MVLMGKGCVPGMQQGWSGVLGDGPPSHIEPCGMGCWVAQEGFVLLWALGPEGVSLWEQRGKRDLPGLGLCEGEIIQGWV